MNPELNDRHDSRGACGGPLTRFARSAWAMFLGLGFIVFAAGVSLATAYSTQLEVWYTPESGWTEMMIYPDVWSWITLPCYGIGLALLTCWYWERLKGKRMTPAA